MCVFVNKIKTKKRIYETLPFNKMMGDESEANINSEDFSFDETVLQLIDDPLKSKTNASSLRTDQNYDGFDSTMGDSWIYPTNYPVRQYQYNISHASLFKNTLVSRSIFF